MGVWGCWSTAKHDVDIIVFGVCVAECRGDRAEVKGLRWTRVTEKEREMTRDTAHRNLSDENLHKGTSLIRTPPPP